MCGIFFTFGNKTILKDEFASVASAHANFVQFLVCREAWEAALDDERGYASRTLLWLRLCIYYER